MSLPRPVKYYNNDGGLIDTKIVNIGWYADGRSMYALCESLVLPEHTHEVEMYGIRIPASVIKMIQDTHQFRVEAQDNFETQLTDRPSNEQR